jgi:hypothetical protein
MDEMDLDNILFRTLKEMPRAIAERHFASLTLVYAAIVAGKVNPAQPGAVELTSL